MCEKPLSCEAVFTKLYARARNATEASTEHVQKLKRNRIINKERKRKGSFITSTFKIPSSCRKNKPLSNYNSCTAGCP